MRREKTRLRDQKIQFWVTAKEHEFISAKAKYCKLTMSGFLRKMSIDGLIIRRDFEPIAEVSKIGININQIAKRVNERDKVIENDLEELRVQYERLFEVMYDRILNG